MKSIQFQDRATNFALNRQKQQNTAQANYSQYTQSLASPEKHTPILFGGSREDKFYKRKKIYTTYSEPFSDARRQLERDPGYERVVNDWDKAATSHPATQVGTVAVAAAMAAAGNHYSAAHHMSDLAAGTLSGASTTTGLLVKPVVKFLFVDKPEKAKKRDLLKRAEDAHDSRVSELRRIARVAKEKARSGAIIWVDSTGNTSDILRGMIADTTQEQEAFKDALPKIKGYRAIKKHVVPHLEKSYKHFSPRRYETDYNVTYDTEFAGPFGGMPVLDDAVRMYGYDKELEQAAYDPDIDVQTEKIKAARHLNNIVPDLISYLKGH